MIKNHQFLVIFVNPICAITLQLCNQINSNTWIEQKKARVRKTHLPTTSDEGTWASLRFDTIFFTSSVVPVYIQKKLNHQFKWLIWLLFKKKKTWSESDFDINNGIDKNKNETHAFPVTANEKLPAHCRLWSNGFWFLVFVFVFSFGFLFDICGVFMVMDP